jgi:hypothetical protein
VTHLRQVRVQAAAVFMIAIVPAIAVAQQFLPNVGPAVDPNTRFPVVAIKAFNDASSCCVLLYRQ